ncbi:TetR/AcrR family transcriptional regulator [Cryptosporangium aurantiacum]|uniref:Transcriptional regulator, TetR family n=1 Tax=Cryptosporangium aurantiacum TaxID=134849 RepID=A0A1M7PCV5_9ACTN|nr:TetR/AcrR family transcriptional regulator [Cryptosporangium aurantiacum]SHN14739.1 transcriptional regulator, TetR family [Cryptosporangium aurantiacum]
MTTSAPARLRADAQRNRDQIIAAAKALFVDDGPEVPMEEIARRAGVGVGTLYRRFPDRETLIHVVQQETYAAAYRDARAAVAEEGTAWDALVRLLLRSADLRVSIRLLLNSPEAWTVARNDPAIRRTAEELLALVDDLMRTAQSDGVLRPDVGVGDIGLLVSLFFRHRPFDAEDASERLVERALILMLDGMRVVPGTPLPGDPVPPKDLLGRG